VASREVLKEEAVVDAEEEARERKETTKKTNSPHVKLSMVIREEAEAVVETATRMVRTRPRLEKLVKKMSTASKLPQATVVVVKVAAEATTARIALANKTKKERTMVKLMKVTNRKGLTNKTTEKAMKKEMRTPEVVDVVEEITEVAEAATKTLLLNLEVPVKWLENPEAVEEEANKLLAPRLLTASKKLDWSTGRLTKRLMEPKEMLMEKCKSKEVTYLEPLLCRRPRATSPVRPNPLSATSSLHSKLMTNELCN
jgi:hypothetical protein